MECGAIYIGRTFNLWLLLVQYTLRLLSFRIFLFRFVRTTFILHNYINKKECQRYINVRFLYLLKTLFYNPHQKTFKNISLIIGSSLLKSHPSTSCSVHTTLKDSNLLIFYRASPCFSAFFFGFPLGMTYSSSLM